MLLSDEYSPFAEHLRAVAKEGMVPDARLRLQHGRHTSSLPLMNLYDSICRVAFRANAVDHSLLSSESVFSPVEE